MSNDSPNAKGSVLDRGCGKKGSMTSAGSAARLGLKRRIEAYKTIEPAKVRLLYASYGPLSWRCRSVGDAFELHAQVQGQKIDVGDLYCDPRARLELGQPRNLGQ